MTDINPYAATAETSLEPGISLPISNRQLWIGYVAAPIVPPALMTLVFLVLAIIGLVTADPNATGTPAGIFIFPIMLMTVGSVISYLAVLFFGMPVIFWLRRNERLSGLTIHLTAMLIGIPLMGVMLLFSATVGPGLTLSEAAGAMLFSMLILAPFALPGGTVFWWLTCRKRKFVDHA